MFLIQNFACFCAKIQKTRQSKLCGFCTYLPRILNLWTFVVNFAVKMCVFCAFI